MWLPAGMEDLQVKWLSARLLDDCDILPCPLIGSRQSVRPPVCPVDIASKERHGEGMGQVFMAPEDLDDPTSIIECRENGVGAVEESDQHRGTYQSLNRAPNALREKKQKEADQSLIHQSSDGNVKLFKTHLKPNTAIVQRSLNIAYPPLFNTQGVEWRFKLNFYPGNGESFAIFNVLHVLKVTEGVNASAPNMKNSNGIPCIRPNNPLLQMI